MTFDPGAVPSSADPLGDPSEAALQERLARARALVDGIPLAADTAGRFLERDVVEALALLQHHERSHFWALKRKLAPFTILSDLNAEIGKVSKELAEGEQKLAEKTQIIALAGELLTLWHDGAEAWCWPNEHGAGCCWRMPGPEVKRYLLAAYGERHQTTLEDGRKIPMAPGRQGVAEALDQLEAMAHAGPKRAKPALRVGGDGTRLVLDLCRDDYSVVVVENGGWSIVKPSPIAMRRAPGMLPLPLPVQGAGDALSDLRKLLNFEGTEHASFWALFVGYMFATLRPVLPYFVFCIAGEQGTGKSMTAKAIRTFVDPHDTDVQPKPRTEDDLFVNADEQRIVAYDNLSTLNEYWSDAFCRISTGIGYSKRKLYTDRETSRFHVARPQIITAIVDVVAAGDLLDRSLLGQQPEIQGGPAVEEELLEAAGALVPRVLGQLLDAAAVALRGQKKVKLHTTPRMVGPTRWIEAGAAVLGLEPGAFLDAYLDSQEHAGEMALDSNLVGMPLVDMLDGRDTLAQRSAEGVLEPPYVGPVGFVGTARDLLKQLNEFMQGKPHPGRGWPRTPKGMGNALRRITPALRKLGYTVERGRAGDAAGTRTIAIDTAYSRAIRGGPIGQKPFGYANNRQNRTDRQKTVGAGVRSDGSDRSDGEKHTQTVLEQYAFRPEAPVEAPRKRRTTPEHTGGRGNGGPDPSLTVASVPFMITKAMQAKLRARGVHPGVIRELRPEDAHPLLDAAVPVPLNATHSPEHDLRELAAVLAGQDSARLAQEAMSYAAKGVVITPATIDAIKAGGEVMYAIRDAIWLALA